VERHPYVTLHRADLVLADLHEFRRGQFGTPGGPTSPTSSTPTRSQQGSRLRQGASSGGLHDPVPANP
jgi:hypothetical protein